MYEFISQASFPVLAVALSLALIGLNGVWSGASEALERSPFGQSHKVWDIELKPGQIRREIGANLRFDVLLGVFTAALLSSGAVRIAPPGEGFSA